MVNTILLPVHWTHILVAVIMHSSNCSKCSLPMRMLLQGPLSYRNWEILSQTISDPFFSLFFDII